MPTIQYDDGSTITTDIFGTAVQVTDAINTPSPVLQTTYLPTGGSTYDSYIRSVLGSVTGWVQRELGSIPAVQNNPQPVKVSGQSLNGLLVIGGLFLLVKALLKG